MADNHNPTPQDLEALDALMRRALPLGEYHRFMDGVSLVYLHRVVQAARREAVAETDGEAVEDKPWPYTPLADALHDHFLHVYGLSREEASESAGDVLDIIAKHTAPPVPAQDDDKLRIAVEALEEITAIEPKPFEGGLDMDAIRACEECRRYANHPIQQGICDTHRRPIWDREKHDSHAEKALGYRAKGIAREALAALKSTAAQEGGE